MTEYTFRSVFKRRQVRFRVIAPATIPSDTSLPIVLLLHGAGTDIRDWTNNSDIAQLAAKNFILVLPDMPDSYYIDEAATGHNDEAFLAGEIMPQVYLHEPHASRQLKHIAIVGISRGGYGSVVQGLRNPSAYAFIGDISGAVDFPERAFRWQTPLETLVHRKVFGPQGSPQRDAVDPYKLVRKLPAGEAPYVYISCGDKDPLLAANQRLDKELSSLRLPHEFHVVHGGHDWNTWNAQLPLLETAIVAHMPTVSTAPAH